MLYLSLPKFPLLSYFLAKYSNQLHRFFYCTCISTVFFQLYFLPTVWSPTYNFLPKWWLYQNCCAFFFNSVWMNWDLNSFQGDLGYLYLDLYSRKGKYPGCAHFAIKGGRRISQTEYQLPVCENFIIPLCFFFCHSNMQFLSTWIFIKMLH
jgi:hypothetical protein